MIRIRCSHIRSMLNELESVNVLMLLNPLNENGYVEGFGAMDEMKREKGEEVDVALNSLVNVHVIPPRCLYPVMSFAVSGFHRCPVELPIPSVIDWVIGSGSVLAGCECLCESLLNGLRGCDRSLNLNRVFYRGSPWKHVNDLFDVVELDGGCFEWSGECEVNGNEVIGSMKEWKGKKYSVGM